MSSTTLHLRHQSTNISPTQENISCISFNFHITKPRISFGPHRKTRPTTHIQVSYAPTETLYKVLGIADDISSSFTLSDIKKAYKNMAKKYHPDVSPPDRVDEYARIFVTVHQAYQTLSDPESRNLYDKDLLRDQRMEEKHEWKIKWQCQLDELKQRNVIKRKSWGARMRGHTL